jgi:GntR family transcriptional repressor for pyruvate dehydrogenase complex
MVGSRLQKGLADLVQVRSILEPEIAALAAEAVDDEDLEFLRQTVATMDTALDDADVFIEADLAFHLTLARATRNAIFPILIDPIIDLLREQRRRMSMVRESAVRGQYHHKRILAAVTEHDSIAARQAMAAHMEQVTEDSRALSSLTD